MSKQPEALRLADGNDECAKAWLDSSDAHKFRKDTAAELRRLHEANAELLYALQKLEEKPDYTTSWLVARAAIAKHGGQ